VAGRALHDLNLKGRYNLLVLGLKNPHATEAEVIVNPPDQATVFGPSVVIALGDTKDVQRARQEASAPPPVSSSQAMRRLAELCSKLTGSEKSGPCPQSAFPPELRQWRRQKRYLEILKNLGHRGE